MPTVRPLYNAVVMLNGSRDNCVALYDATAAELAMLRVMHGAGESGNDPIMDVKPTGKGVERSDDQERARIGLRYNAPGNNNGLHILNSMFGVGNKLPLEYVAPEPVKAVEAPLAESERIVEMNPTGPITSLPDKKPAKPASMLDD